MSKSSLVFSLVVVFLSMLLVAACSVYYWDKMIDTMPLFMWAGLGIIAGGIILAVIIIREIRKV